MSARDSTNLINNNKPSFIIEHIWPETKEDLAFYDSFATAPRYSKEQIQEFRNAKMMRMNANRN